MGGGQAEPEDGYVGSHSPHPFFFTSTGDVSTRGVAGGIDWASWVGDEPLGSVAGN